MMFSKIVIFFFFLLLLLSIFVARLFIRISVDDVKLQDTYYSGYEFAKYLGEKYGRITNSSQNIIWFLQISDIHISIFRDPARISQFQQFCDNTVKVVKPTVVLATGDLTDAKAKDNLGSSQVKREWIYYYNVIQESGVTQYTTWLDIRGNHDNFNIRTIDSEENFYRNYSVQGVRHSKSYSHYINHNGVSVSFLGIDACPDPGLRRPFNFIGILNKLEQQSINKLKHVAEKEANHIIWFGHYPTSCILSLEYDSQRMDLRQFIGSANGSQVYVCGHLHSMGGFVPNMYTKHKRGFLELELGDWKDNRMFRLAAIDHGIFSFIDQRHNTWPLILVTNPKHAQYTMPGREPLHLISESTHIRILVFSDVKVISVRISFNQLHWTSCKAVNRSLYACLWSPRSFLSGLHKLYVVAVDELERESAIEHPFALDGTTKSFDILARILLMIDAGVMFQGIFGTLLILNVVPLVILRLQKRPPKYRRGIDRHILRRVWLLSKIDRIFYPIIIYAIYLPFGPWAMGELIDGYIGTIFAWGILIKGVLLPEPFTYMYGSVQLMFVQIPLVFVLACSLETRLFGHNIKGVRQLIKNLPFIFILSIQLLLAYFFWLEYGTLSFLFGPLRTWSVVMSILLWYKTLTLPPDYCRYLMKLNDHQL